jgi:hypothetical protein
MQLKETRDELSSSAQLSPEQREAVVEEMNRILAEPAFHGSKRCVVLFKYLVNSTLRGNHIEFKERTLGIEVFGRDPGYDSQADPIVRVTANEIRKRLGQCYYEEQGSRRKVRIRLARGGYIPEFDFGEIGTSVSNEVEQAAESFEMPVQHVSRISEPKVASKSFGHRWLLWLSIAVLTAFVGAAFYNYSHPSSRQDAFWDPLLHFDQPVTVCVADDPSLLLTSEGWQSQSPEKPKGSSPGGQHPYLPDGLPVTPFVDMTTANQITNWFVARGRKTFLQRASTATLHIFRQGPAVIIGGFDNQWSQILTSGLRYRIQQDALTGEKWIQDSQNPSKRDWNIKAGLHFDDSYTDYALITRFWNNETASWIIAISSLGPHGLRAASELLTDPSFSKSLPKNIRSNMNVQIIVTASIVKGTSSAPQVLGVNTW